MKEIILFVFCVISVVHATNNSSWEEMQMILNNNSLTTPPWFGKAEPTLIEISLYLTQMRNLGRVAWTDQRLQYVSKQSDDYVILNSSEWSKIWTPDTFIPNELQATMHSATTQNNYIRIYNNGTVFKKTRLTVLFLCKMQLQHFPHDKQTCWMKFLSFSYPSKDVSMAWSKNEPVNFSPDYISVHLRMLGFNTVTCQSYMDGESYSCLQFVMDMDREHHGYVLRVYMPSFFIVTMSWISLWIDKEQVSARTSLGTLCVVSILTQILSLIILMPDAIELKAIDIWLGACMAFVTASFIIFAIVHYMKRQQKRRKALLDKYKQATENGDEVKEPKKAICRLTSGRVEEIARYLYAIAFIAFNIVYWVYFLI